MKPEKHKIARIVVDGRHCDKNGFLKINKLITVVKRFIRKTHGKQKFDFVVTAGGYLSFDFPEHLQVEMPLKKAEKELVPRVFDAAEPVILSFFDKLGSESVRKLQSITKYMTIGIDGWNDPTNDQSIELVALFDLKKKKVIHWTGKFYPTEGEPEGFYRVRGRPGGTGAADS